MDKTFIFEGSFVFTAADLDGAVDELISYITKHRENAFENVGEL